MESYTIDKEVTPHAFSWEKLLFHNFFFVVVTVHELRKACRFLYLSTLIIYKVYCPVGETCWVYVDYNILEIICQLIRLDQVGKHRLRANRDFSSWFFVHRHHVPRSFTKTGCCVRVVKRDVSRHRHAELTFGWPPFSAWHVGIEFSACGEKVVRYIQGDPWRGGGRRVHHLNAGQNFAREWNEFLSRDCHSGFFDREITRKTGKWRFRSVR